MNDNKRKVMIFIGLTFTVSWLIIAVFTLLGGNWNSTTAYVIAIGYMFIPMIMSIIVQKSIYKQKLKEPFEISFKFNKWFFIAWLLPPVMAFATLGISLLFPGVSYSPGMEGMFERYASTLKPEQLELMRTQLETFPVHILWIALLQGLLAGITINAVAGLGEELGWRGFLQKELSYLGFLKSSVLIGVIWGVWHAPIILHGHNYPQHPVTGVFMMTLWCALLGPVISYLRIKAKSVIARRYNAWLNKRKRRHCHHGSKGRQ